MKEALLISKQPGLRTISKLQLNGLIFPIALIMHLLSIASIKCGVAILPIFGLANDGVTLLLSLTYIVDVLSVGLYLKALMRY